MNYIVDRIEGEFAVCEDERGRMVDIKLSALPAGIKEGASFAMDGGVATLLDDSDRRRRIEEKMKKAFGRKG